MSKTCIFCLQLNSQVLSIHDKDLSDIIKIFFPSKNIITLRNSVICIDCYHCLQSAYKFTKSAMKNNSRKHTTSIRNDNLCETCLESVENIGVYLFDHFENVLPFYEIKEMLDYCSLELDTEFHQYPIICSTCWEKLKISYNFLKKCAENERRSSQLCNAGNIPQKSALLELQNEVPNIKLEFDEHTIKQEPQDTVSEISKQGQGCDLEFVDVPCLKKERSDMIFEKELHVDLVKLNSHESSHRKHKKRRTTKSSIHKCHNCSFTTAKICTYNQHMTRHLTLDECEQRNMLFKCKICPYYSKRRDSLQRHLRVVHPSKYICECGYETDIAESFELHQTEHETPVSYKCNECYYTSNSKHKLRKHELGHNLLNITLKCSECGFETKDVAVLKAHRQGHFNVKTLKLYKCEKCSYQVKKKSSIDRHMLTHLTRRELIGNLHACFECHYKTKRKDSLAVHIQKQHRGRGKRKTEC